MYLYKYMYIYGCIYVHLCLNSCMHIYIYVYMHMCTSIPRYCMHVRNSTCECTVLLKRDSRDTRGPLGCHVCSHFCLFLSLSLSPSSSLSPFPLSLLVSTRKKLSGASAARGRCCTKFCDVQAFSREVGDSFLPRHAQRPASVAVRRLYQYHRPSP